MLVVVQLISSVQLFANQWTAACQASLSFTISQSLLKLMSIVSMMPSNHLILCFPLLLLPSIIQHHSLFPWISSSHQVAKILKFQLQCQSFQWLFGVHSFRINWFGLLADQGTLKSPQAPVWKHQFFSTQPYLWSNSHIRTWLLEKLWLWLYGPLSAKWCLYLLIHCLGLS